MMEAIQIPVVERAITRVKTIKRRVVGPLREHSDLRKIRRHRAAESALRDLEQLKDRALIENARIGFFR
ncbi:MAG: hypothetical protein RTU09_07465 [Candidatus Thorarchaeota archaeon]